MATAEPASGWDAVRLTEARQVAALMEQDRDAWPAAEVGVGKGYHGLRDAGRPSDAAEYLAHALPRLEAVAWAIRAVADAAEAAPPAPTMRGALDAAQRWLGDRSDLHRRAAHDAAVAIGKPVAERFVGYAIFYSGGSIAPAGQQPVTPPEQAAARYVAAALRDLAYRSGDAAAAWRWMLDLGEAVATRGLPALDR